MRFLQLRKNPAGKQDTRYPLLADTPDKRAGMGVTLGVYDCFTLKGFGLMRGPSI